MPAASNKSSNGSSGGSKSKGSQPPAVPDIVKNRNLQLSSIDLEADQPAFQTPEGEFSAAMDGMIKIADDGSHQVSGKWALTRDDLHDESKTSKFDMILDIKKEVRACRVSVV